jgi:hypothetical protein
MTPDILQGYTVIRYVAAVGMLLLLFIGPIIVRGLFTLYRFRLAGIEIFYPGIDTVRSLFSADPQQLFANVMLDIKRSTPDLSQLNPNFTPDLSQLNPNFTPDLSQLNPNFTPDLSQLHPNFTRANQTGLYGWLTPVGKPFLLISDSTILAQVIVENQSKLTKHHAFGILEHFRSTTLTSVSAWKVIHISNFHVLCHLLLIYICKLQADTDISISLEGNSYSSKPVSKTPTPNST